MDVLKRGPSPGAREGGGRHFVGWADVTELWNYGPSRFRVCHIYSSLGFDPADQTLCLFMASGKTKDTAGPLQRIGVGQNLALKFRAAAGPMPKNLMARPSLLQSPLVHT